MMRILRMLKQRYYFSNVCYAFYLINWWKKHIEKASIRSVMVLTLSTL